MPGRTPSTLNIKLGDHEFTMNPNKMEEGTAAARTLFTNLLGGTIISDLVTGGAVITKRTWKFSGIDDGDCAAVVALLATPGSLAFRDVYGDTYTVALEAEVPRSVEGRRPLYGDFSFSLREV